MENLHKLFYSQASKKDFFFPIVRNISNILNTRSSLPLGDFLDTDISSMSVVNYGLPSFTHLSMTSERDIEILCLTVAKSIVAFEHRLSNVNVSFTSYDPLKKEAKIALSAVYVDEELVLNLLLKIALWEFIVHV
ncbi:type VI secretion system baseplate subunit TssE [Pigmentibacter ruber]|nr:hypothetical protein GTC16762_24750 [Pigmentibacter ruber]